MNAGSAAALGACLLTACASVPDARTDDTSRAVAEPDRYLVLAVANTDTPMPMQAGATPGTYGMRMPYASGGAARSRMEDIERQYGLQEAAAWPIRSLGLHCVLAKLPDGKSGEAVLAALQGDKRLDLAQPLQRFSTYAEGYNDPYAMLQRGFVDLDAVDAHRMSRGDGVRIAVIDTGADVRHPDLEANVAATRNFVDRDAARFERDRHGTAIAGVIAAVANNGEGIVGVAPGARLEVIKACWQTDTGSGTAECNSFTLAQALEAAMAMDAQIINLSLGGPSDPLLARLLARAVEQRRIVVAAVPPDGRFDGFPLGVPGVIAVARADRPAAGGRALAAPGQDILTLSPGTHYDYESGSSLAAAHVSAAAALLLAANPKIDATQIFGVLKHSMRQTKSGESIDACTALASFGGGSSCAGVAPDATRTPTGAAGSH
jgi:subtilisin family serine protease